MTCYRLGLGLGLGLGIGLGLGLRLGLGLGVRVGVLHDNFTRFFFGNFIFFLFKVGEEFTSL